MRRFVISTVLFFALGACGGGGSSSSSDNRLSMAGNWVAIDNGTDSLIGPVWHVVKAGPDQLEGVALSGWAYTGSATGATVTPVRAVVLQQQSNGLLTDATSTLFGDAMTNGAGSVIVADFNGDGRDDVVFPAHNESPFIAMSSTAFMSRADGRFDKLVLPDSVMNHDARLVTLGARKAILSKSFGGSGNGGQGPGFNVIYTWNGSNFAVDLSLGDLSGMSVLAGQFSGGTDDWIIIGDSAGGPGVPYAPNSPMQNYAYKYVGGKVVLPPTLLPKPYFNDKPEYASFVSQWDPYSKTHTSRLWSTDLNQDGLPDILAGQEIWSSSKGGQRTVYQLLINRGGMTFTDETDTLKPEYDKVQGGMDYSVRLADIDGSGIDSMFLSSGYLLVNDGTGRLYAALHSEFDGFRVKVADYAQAQVPSTQLTTGVFGFYPYRTKEGRINYVAGVSTKNRSNLKNSGSVFVNFALGYNLSTDFQRDLTLATRNGSRNIRTFAGNDTIYRAIGDPDCRIDGGLGINTVVYPGNRADWIIGKSGSQVTVRPSSNVGGLDNLTRIQKLQFGNLTVDTATLP